MTKFEIISEKTGITDGCMGDLLITLTEDGKTEFNELIEDLQISRTDLDIFLELIEPQLCNGYHTVRPEHIGALTDSLLISDEIIDNETTQKELNEATVWYYNDYMVKSYLDDFIGKGYIIFSKA